MEFGGFRHLVKRFKALVDIEHIVLMFIGDKISGTGESGCVSGHQLNLGFYWCFWWAG